MNKTKIWSILVMLLFTTPFFAQNNERKKVDGVAAVVGDYLILESDIDKAYIDLQQQEVDTREINRCQMLGKLMEDKLYAHQAVQDSVKLTDSEVRDQVNQRIEFLTAQLGGDIKKLLQFYKKDDEQSMRDELFNLLKVSMLAQRMKQQIIKDVEVTPEEIRTFFNAIPADERPHFGTELEIAQIVVNPVAPKSSVQKVIDQLLQDGRSHNYVSKIKFKLNQIMKFAVRMNYIDTNEMLFVEMPRKVITADDLRKKNTKYLDQKEFKLFIQNLKEEALCDYRINKYIRIAKVLFLTGMRYGELAALNYKEDIDFSKKTIHIKHTYDFRQKERTTPKTIKSDRVITAPQKVLDIIKEQILENTKNGFDTDSIFINTLGEPITSARVIIPLKNHGKKLGIDKNITTHMFRHSHISLLAELGIPLTAIMDRVGHSDSKTTLEIYSHVTQKMVSDISSKLEKIKL